MTNDSLPSAERSPRRPEDPQRPPDTVEGRPATHAGPASPPPQTPSPEAAGERSAEGRESRPSTATMGAPWGAAPTEPWVEAFLRTAYIPGIANAAALETPEQSFRRAYYGGNPFLEDWMSARNIAPPPAWTARDVELATKDGHARGYREGRFHGILLGLALALLLAAGYCGYSVVQSGQDASAEVRQ